MLPENNVKLAGIAYPIAWGNLAERYFYSIPREERELTGPATLAQLLWASYRGIKRPFKTWHEVMAALAELSDEDYAALDECMAAHLPVVKEPAKTGADSPASPAPELTEEEKKSGLTKPAPSPAGS